VWLLPDGRIGIVALKQQVEIFSSECEKNFSQGVLLKKLSTLKHQGLRRKVHDSVQIFGTGLKALAMERNFLKLCALKLRRLRSKGLSAFGSVLKINERKCLPYIYYLSRE
jgi:hypothetical protein